MITIANANALHIPLPDQSVQCIVTSPPYYGLRDYGTAGQIGLESTPAAYVASIVTVMRECWRVLKDDGVLFLNLGDSYFGDSPTRKSSAESFSATWDKSQTSSRGGNRRSAASVDGLKPKDLCGIPWRVAFALQDDGWFLRQDIIWSKPNPMPESVTDRCTKAHEYVFLLTKRARYYYDAEAIKEPPSASTIERWGERVGQRINPRSSAPERNDYNENGGEVQLGMSGNGRNRRSVWTVATSPYSGAHFATFPPALIEPMILAGTSARGECPHCGKAWVRVVEQVGFVAHQTAKGVNQGDLVESRDIHFNNIKPKPGSPSISAINETVGWRQQCDCPPHEPIPQTVLDPFAGSGTTGRVAVKHGRRAVLLDLNTKYIDLMFERTNGVQMTLLG